MNAARIETSERLRRVLTFLRYRGGYGATTLEISQECAVCAVNSIIGELRQNGYRVDCRREGSIYRYTLREGKEMTA